MAVVIPLEADKATVYTLSSDTHNLCSYETNTGDSAILQGGGWAICCWHVATARDKDLASHESSARPGCGLSWRMVTSTVAVTLFVREAKPPGF